MSDQRPVFLEKRSYRRRRMMDAVRLLPAIGLALCMVPLMWQVGGTDEAEAVGVSMSAALRYVFGIWLFLVAVAAILSWQTRAIQENDIEGEEGS